MKILIVHNHYVYSGGEDEVVKAEKDMLEKFGHEVILYEQSNSQINKKSFFKRVSFVLKDIYWSKKTYDEITKIIEDQNPDVAHFHNTFFSISPSAYDACYDAQVPIVQTLHNYRFLCPIGVFYREGSLCEDCLRMGEISAVINKCWKNSYFHSFVLVNILKRMEKQKIISEKIKSYIALSAFSRQKFIDQGFPKEKVFIKPNFLESDPGVVQDIGLYGVFIGALRDYKGIKILLKAWQGLKSDFPLKVLGVGPLENELKASVQGEEIEFLGNKPLTEVFSIIKGSRFLVAPSECYETFSRVTMEAFACGVPVIATNHGALKDIVEHKKTGLLFERGNSDDLASKISELIESSSLVKELGQNARKVYQKKYTEAVNYDRLIEIYERTIEANSRRKDFN